MLEKMNEFYQPRMVPEEGKEEDRMVAIKTAALHREVC